MNKIVRAFVLTVAAASLCCSAALAQTTRASTGGSDPSVVAALLHAGGGPTSFEVTTALDAMVGTPWTDAELAKLRAAYGPAAVRTWREVSDYAVTDAARRAREDAVMIPPPAAGLTGKALARRLIRLANTPGGYLLSGVMVDAAVARRIRTGVVSDIDQKFGAQDGSRYLRISNRVLYDLAHRVGMTDVKLAALH